MGLKISHFQTFCLHDGPGIRTTIFLSGCPLRCVWCHNPETQSVVPTVIFDKKVCIGCKLCEICQNGVHSFENEHMLNRSLCTVCGKCIEICPAEALDVSVKNMTTNDFFALVKKQKQFSQSGGITFSGGEPLCQGEEILRLIENTDIHTAIETCGYADKYLFEKVVEKIDYVMYDLKIADSKLHEKYTGKPNDVILQNFEILKNSSKPYVIRTPLIPGITDTKENLDAIERIVGLSPWEKLPYNVLTPSKYERLGKNY